MSGVDDTRMRGLSGFRPRTSMIGFDVERNSDDDGVLAFDFGVERLPPGQAGAATSITGPRDEDDLLAAQ